MGLPQVLIEFKAKADTAVKRSENGIVAVILKDTTNTTFDTKIYTSEAEIVTSHWNTANRDYLAKIFLGSPNRVIVERIGTSSSTIPTALARLASRAFNYLCMPGATADDFPVIAAWIRTQRDSLKKTYA
jgi:hypothetical protein